MIAFPIYLIVLLSLIYFSSFFGLFKDPVISRKQLTLLFFGKAVAVPVFIFVYTKLYGGIQDFDAGKFYHDATLLSDYGKSDPGFLVRLLLGLQNDSKGSADYEHILQYTLNWDNGTVKDYLYNDNRVVIRAHVLLNFIAFNLYSVHALLNCFVSFTGIFFLYKTFKDRFTGKELPVLLILCFFPALWFYTGALLKEGIVLFVLGCTLYQLKKTSSGQYSLLSILWLSCLVFICLLLKPYLLFFAVACFALFFLIQRLQKIKRKTLVFLSVMCFVVLLINTASLLLKHRSLSEAALKHQHRFIGVSRGGIFLSDSLNFIRLTNDTGQVKRVTGKKDIFTIRKDVSYMYWKTADQKDTLYCVKNTDTSTHYRLAYIIQQSQSNIDLPRGNAVYTLGACLYYTLFHPSFYTARNALQLLAAFENLGILAGLVALIWGLFKSKKEKFLPAVFIFFALSLCILIGLTAPNSGAIFRYRSPAMVFLLLAALYFLPGSLFPNAKIRKNKPG